MKQNCVIVLVGILAYSGIVGAVNGQCVTNQTVAVPTEKYAAFIVPDSGAALTLTITSAPPRTLVSSGIVAPDTSDTALWSPITSTGPGPHVYESGPVLSSREWLRISGILDGGGGHGGEGHGGGGSQEPEVFNVDVPAVDIAMAGVDEDKEETPGGYVGVGTNCLQKVTINKVKSINRFTTGKVKLTVTGGAKVRLWEEATRIHEIVTFPKEYTTPSGLPKDIWVEGIAASATNRDVELKASYTTPTENKTTEDKVKITVLKCDIDIDTDNNGTIDADDSGEDQFEEYAPGRILCVNGYGINTNTDYLAEIKLAIQPTLTTGTAKLEALDGGSRIKVWTTTNKTTEVTLPKTYDLTTTNPPSSLYVDGIATGKVQLAFSYTAGTGGFTCTDQVAMLIIPTIAYAPGKGSNAFVWASLMTTSNSNSGNNLGWADGTEFENQIKEQGWPTVTWFKDTTGDTDTNFGSCTLANYKGMTNGGIFTVVSHGEEGGHPAIYAEYSTNGRTSVSNWISGETNITLESIPPGGGEPGFYYARVSSSWLSANWKAAMDANRTISFWSICYSATSNTVSGEDAVKECAGGRWRVGYIDPTTETEAKDTNERLLKRMNGSTDSARKCTAGEAYESGSGYSANAKMDGNDWTTLCPAPLADNAVFPDTTAGNRKGWGCIIFDTYMSTTNAASDALTKQSGCPTSDHRWFGNTDGTYGLGFDFDKTGGAATTMRAVADKCRNDGLGGGRELDGNRVKPNNDNRDWSF